MTIAAGPVPKTSAQLFVEQALAKGGLTADHAQLLQLGFQYAPAALATQKVDAAWEIEPLATVAEDRGIASRCSAIWYRLPILCDGCWHTYV